MENENGYNFLATVAWKIVLFDIGYREQSALRYLRENKTCNREEKKKQTKKQT